MNLLEDVSVLDYLDDDVDYLKVRIVFGMSIKEANDAMPSLCKWEMTAAVVDLDAFESERANESLSFAPIPGSPNFQLVRSPEPKVEVISVWVPGLDVIREQDGHVIYEEDIEKTAVTSSIVRELYDIYMNNPGRHAKATAQHVEALLQCLHSHWH